MSSIRIGSLSVPSTELGIMEDSSSKVNDTGFLRSELKNRGFVLLRGQIPPEKLRKSKMVVANVLDKDFEVVDPDKGPLVEAHIRKGCSGMLLTGYSSITHHPDVLQVLEGPELLAIFTRVFGEAPVTYDTKWVRVMGTTENTDEHSDFFRFAHAADRMYTCWIPMDSYKISEGTLAICEGSHLFDGYNQSDSFAESKSELPPEFERQRANDEMKWVGADFNVGDILIFDIRSVHASTANTTERFRISMDTRWQPRSIAQASGYTSQWRLFNSTGDPSG